MTILAAIPAARPVKLELNNSGSWKTLARFDAYCDESADKARAIGQLLGELAPRSKLQISTDEALPVVLIQWTAAKGWHEWVHPGQR